MKLSLLLILFFIVTSSSQAFWDSTNTEDENTDNPRGILTTVKSREITQKQSRSMQSRLNRYSLKLGAAIYMRAFKKEELLEVWMEAEDGKFRRFKTYKICKQSGGIGPKLEEGDDQVPEGFYNVSPERLNPKSRFHLAFNVGFPNEFDSYHQRTGSYIMVHGRCSSSGCLAMKNDNIEEIYTLAQAALLGGQETFRVDIMPFKMTDKNLSYFSKQMPIWADFWSQLKDGYDFFEENKIPGQVYVIRGRYEIQ